MPVTRHTIATNAKPSRQAGGQAKPNAGEAVGARLPLSPRGYISRNKMIHRALWDPSKTRNMDMNSAPMARHGLLSMPMKTFARQNGCFPDDFGWFGMRPDDPGRSPINSTSISQNMFSYF